ncbi:3-deoxy-D-manno-octulosonic acid kinase [Vibrio sinaloensis]|uniref:3-deoxy-D-manno-octulosonic acid kinase n=1 Tax=Photobacterium sp. (strain ATCC 43367) TaxID=379097 RepID=UPI000A43CD03|nr:3-deoxy-D-manno-octulosonic acid kinase [Vibrio sinaloensis]
MIREYQTKNQVVWFDEQLLREDPSQAFDVDFWQQNDAIIGSAEGRGTTWFIQTQTMQAALRHYRRGGLFGKLVSDSYWFTGWQETRSYAEFQLLKTLADAGVHVPKPIAARAITSGLTYRADLISEKIAHAEDLVGILQRREMSAEEYYRVGVEIAKMHHAQVNHTDLNIHNLLLDRDGQVWIIDFDKCYHQDGTDWQQNNLDRLLRSFVKEKNKRSIHWQEAHFSPLLEGYQQYK